MVQGSMTQCDDNEEQPVHKTKTKRRNMSLSLASDNPQDDKEQKQNVVVTDNGGESKQSAATDDMGASTPQQRKRKRKRKRRTNENNDNDDMPNQTDAPEQQQDSVQHQQERLVAEVDRTVFVEGIPYICTEDDVRSFFLNNDSAEENEEASSSILECRLPIWPDTGRLKGFGHVVFSTVEQRNAAITKSGQFLKGRYLTIQPAKAPSSTRTGSTAVPSSSECSNVVMLNNLSYDATEDDIETLMSKFGVIAQGGIRLVRHNATKRSRGFCYVEYESLDSAKLAVTQGATVSGSRGIVILNRQCRIEYDHGTGVAPSFRTSTGRLWQKSFGKTSAKPINKKITSKRE